MEGTSTRIDFVRIEMYARGGLKAGELLRSIYVTVEKSLISVPRVAAIARDRLVESEVISREEHICLVNEDVVEICNGPSTRSESLAILRGISFYCLPNLI